MGGAWSTSLGSPFKFLTTPLFSVSFTPLKLNPLFLKVFYLEVVIHMSSLMKRLPVLTVKPCAFFGFCSLSYCLLTVNIFSAFRVKCLPSFHGDVDICFQFHPTQKQTTTDQKQKEEEEKEEEEEVLRNTYILKWILSSSWLRSPVNVGINAI